MKEAQFQNYVVRLARENGWLIHHTRTALAKSGRYMTPVQGHIGFPDLVLLHREREILVFAELKNERGLVRREQRQWLELLKRIPCIFVCLWRPKMLDAIEQFLTLQTDLPPGTWAGKKRDNG